MKSITDKLILFSKLNNIKPNIGNCKRLVTEVNIVNNVNEINYNLVKKFKISVECNAFDVNEDKQRQCYKQWKCFWPKCRYSCGGESILNNHISHHLNKRQFVCEECNKHFNRNSNLRLHKRYVHSNDRPFVCNQINCNKKFKTCSNLVYHKKLVHSNHRPFVCPQNNCNQKFKLRSHLNRHKRIHCSDK